MEKLILEQAALNHANKEYNGSPAISTVRNISFQAGAEWQKEQYTRILQLAFNAANELDSLGAAYLCGEIKTELERLLQD
jgi:hypothetical protein